MSDSYKSYQGMVAQVNTALTQMEGICRDLEMQEGAKALYDSREKLQEHRFAVGILGEFKRGKSTVINSLLEKEIMPADILPCSATMNRVTYGMEPKVELFMQNGSVRPIAVEDLADYVTKLNSANESRAADVMEAVVYYPCRFCQNGVDIVDTPGLNDDERMNRITEEVIPKLDAVIMVILPDSPFSMSEAEFVRSKLMASDLSRLIFLVNKIDTIRRPADRQRAVDGIKEKIQTTVLEKMADVYGKDSKQYKDAALKLGDIRVLPFSALDALEGKDSGDQKMIDSSGTVEFENTLTHMLTEERGALELGTPINVIQRTALEVAQTIETRRGALDMSAEEFRQEREKALVEIQALRNQKREEQQRLKGRAKAVKADMAARVAQFYPELEQRMEAVVDNFTTDLKPLATPTGQKEASEKLQSLVTSEMNTALAAFSERTISELQDILNQEAVAAAEITKSISSQLDRLRVDLSAKQRSQNKADLVATGVDVLTDFAGIYGIGGIVAGYQTAGFKGAAVGGGIGLVANLTVAAILGSLSIVGLPMLVLSCAAGTFVSKKVSSLIFSAGIGKKKLDEIKAEMNDNIIAAIRDMQVQRDLENWVEKLVVDRFDELIVATDAECERMLLDSQHTLDQIQRDLAQGEAARKASVQQLDDAGRNCAAILKDLEPTWMNIQSVLKGA